MNDLRVKSLYIYPVKSLGGVGVQEAEVQQRGLKWDRRWMLTDQEGTFISQRTYPQMAMLQVNLTANGLMVTLKQNLITPLTIPYELTTNEEVTVSVWDDTCRAVKVSAIANEWFSEALKFPVKLVYMPATTQRLVDIDYATNKEIVSFADAYPFMMIGQSSLDDLNSRLDRPVLMNRFRPNIVFTGSAAYSEDIMHTFRISNITFHAVKPCARCVLTTIDQEQATKGVEPLKTLSTYRTIKNKVMFGQNLLHERTGAIRVGDQLIIEEWKK